MEDEYRLTIINWNDNEIKGTFYFKEFNLNEPDEVIDFRTNEVYKTNKGRFYYKLDKHESIVIR